MRFESLDLNLLIALDALLRERSVSLAAERIGLSQSATSSALSRLRAFFDDDLLVLRGRTMLPTARGEELMDPVAAVLAQVRATIIAPEGFDPARSERTLSIVTSDYSVEVLVAGTLRKLSVEAPLMKFRIVFIGDEPILQLERGKVDIAITNDGAVSTEHPSTPLFEDVFALVGWRGNPALSEPVSEQVYARLGHVAVRFGRTQQPSFEEYALRRGSVERRIEVVAPNFVSVAPLVTGTMRIAIMPRRLALRLREQYDLVVATPPMALPPLRIVAQYMESNRRDAGLTWFIDRLRRHALESLDSH